VGYFLLTGSLVFEGDNALQLVLKHIQAEPVAPSLRLGQSVPDALERVILGCLAKAPGSRPADAVTLADALTLAGADDWTQADAKRWWETTFTPKPSSGPPVAPPTEFLEVAAPHGGS
jgi:serine/threonine-protein kinase